MNRKHFIFFMIIQSILSFCAVAQSDEETDTLIKERTVILNLCSDPKIGYQIKCNPDWLMSDEPNSVMMFIIDEPDLSVTATINKSSENSISLESLTPEKLRFMGQYDNEIRVDQASVGGARAIKVKAKPKDVPQMQLLDYYFVKDGQLYTVLFAVNPSERFDEFQELFDKMIESFEFIKS